MLLERFNYIPFISNFPHNIIGLSSNHLNIVWECLKPAIKEALSSPGGDLIISGQFAVCLKRIADYFLEEGENDLEFICEIYSDSAEWCMRCGMGNDVSYIWSKVATLAKKAKWTPEQMQPYRQKFRLMSRQLGCLQHPDFGQVAHDIL